LKRKRAKAKAIEYEVEAILNKRQNDDGEYEYEVKWKNYDSSQNTWEPLNNLKHSMEFVVLYEQKHEDVNKFEVLSNDNANENQCSKCDYVGVNHADKCVHLSSVHKVRVPVRCFIPDINELDHALIKHLQENEQEFKIIYDTNFGENISSELLGSREKRMFNSHEFILSADGLLYCIDVSAVRMKSKVRTQLRLCIPKTMRKSIVTQVHAGFFAPHFGVVHTYDKLRENVWWPSMLHYVNTFISECDVCKKSKGNKTSIPVVAYRIQMVLHKYR
jgi:hypothetical protein